MLPIRELVATRCGENPHQRPGGAEEGGLLARDGPTVRGQGDTGVDHLRIGLARVGETEVDHAEDALPVAEPSGPALQVPLADERRRVQGKLGGHLQVGPLTRDRDRRVDQGQTLDEVGVSRGHEEGDHPAHRVANEDRRRADDLADEVGDHLGVGLHRRRTVGAPRQPEPGHINGVDPVVRGQFRRDPHPVEMRTAQTMEHDDRDSGLDVVDHQRPAEFDPVHRATEVTQPTPSAPGRRQLEGRRRRGSLGGHWSITIPGRLTSGPASGALA